MISTRQGRDLSPPAGRIWSRDSFDLRCQAYSGQVECLQSSQDLPRKPIQPVLLDSRHRVVVDVSTITFQLPSACLPHTTTYFALDVCGLPALSLYVRV